MCSLEQQVIATWLPAETVFIFFLSLETAWDDRIHYTKVLELRYIRFLMKKLFNFEAKNNFSRYYMFIKKSRDQIIAKLSLSIDANLIRENRQTGNTSLTEEIL